MNADHLDDPFQWNIADSTHGDLTVNARAFKITDTEYYGGQWRITNAQNGRPLHKLVDEPFADAKAAKLNALTQAIKMVEAHQAGKRNPKFEILYGPVAIL
jgi:hypothetical protein